MLSRLVPCLLSPSGRQIVLCLSLPSPTHTASSFSAVSFSRSLSQTNTHIYHKNTHKNLQPCTHLSQAKILQSIPSPPSLAFDHVAFVTCRKNFFLCFFLELRSSSRRSYPWTDHGHGWVQGEPPSVIRSGWYGWSNPPIRHPSGWV